MEHPGNSIHKMENAANIGDANHTYPLPDFSNTAIAFAHKTNEELRKSARIFGLMNNHWLVGVGSKLGIAAIRFAFAIY